MEGGVRKTTRSMPTDKYRHVFGCMSDIQRRLSKARHALEQAAAALDADDIEAGREWLNEADGQAEAAQREARTSSHALAAVRDREGL